MSGVSKAAPLLAAPTPPADIPQVKTPVISKSKKSKPDAVSSPFVELVVAGSAVHATGGPNAATLRLDALDLILRGIRQLIQEHP